MIPVSYGFNMYVANAKVANQVAPAKTVLLFEVYGNTADPTSPYDWRSTAANGGDGGGAGYIDYCIIAIHGLLNPDERNFAAPITLQMATPFAGTEIRYTLTGEEPTPTSPRYTAPVSVTVAQATQVYQPAYYGRQVEIRARCFEPDGTPFGETSVTTVRNDAPRLTYALYRPAPGTTTFPALPDFSALAPVEKGVLGRIGSAANFQRGKGPLALVALAQFEAEGDGDYTFTLAAFLSGRLLFDEMPVCEVTTASRKRSVEGTVHLTKGRHQVRIEYGTNDGTVQLDVSIEKFPIRTKHHWEDRGLYEWLIPLEIK